MLYSELAGKRVSRLGFGGMRFPEKDGKIDRAAALEMIDLAYQNGVNYYDTAYAYHGGDSEAFMKEALSRYPRESFYLTTKLPIWLVKTEADVCKYFDEQRAKCGVEYFDYYLLHSLDRHRWAVVKETNAYEQLLERKRQGQIGALGFSFHGDFDTFCEVVDAYEWDFVQIQINYIDYVMQDAKAYHDKLNEKGIPCIVMEPVRGGFLANLPETAEKELAAVGDAPAADWALRWCMDMPNMPLILSGMSTLEQVKQNLATFSELRPLSDAEKSAIERAREAVMAIKTVPCTACGYCMDCSFGVDIPGVFRIYNEYKLFKNAWASQTAYNQMGDGHRGDSCVQCGACSPMCPQGIAIPDRLAEVHAEISAIVLD